MSELATATKVDPVLLGTCTIQKDPHEADTGVLGRILRNLSAYGAVKEVGEDGYTSTTVSKTFSTKDNQYALEFW